MSGLDFSDLSGAASDLFGGIGDLSEASAYQKAAQYATENAAITQRSTAIQEMQATRQIYQVNSATIADTAASGLDVGSGSGQYLMRSNAQQGSLTKQLIENQGLINEQGYLAEASADQGMAASAKAAASGGFLSGLINGIAGVASLF